DLEPGMILEGVVTNVANFGAFVDIGVHQDGLVHVSALSNKFVRDPHEVAKTGDLVKVKVMEVDPRRQRIGLSMRLDDQPGAASRRPAGGESAGSTGARNGRGQGAPAGRGSQPAQVGALAAAFAAARKPGGR